MSSRGMALHPEQRRLASVLIEPGPQARAFACRTRATAEHSQPRPLDELRVQQFLLQLPVLMISIVAHEYAHGYAALKQGDQTALMLGRLSFNPLKHIDPFMTVLLPR